MDLKKYRRDIRSSAFTFLQEASKRTTIVVEGKDDEIFYTSKTSNKNWNFVRVDKVNKKLNNKDGVIKIREFLSQMRTQIYYIIDKDFSECKSNENLFITKGYSFENYIFTSEQNKNKINLELCNYNILELNKIVDLMYKEKNNKKQLNYYIENSTLEEPKFDFSKLILLLPGKVMCNIKNNFFKNIEKIELEKLKANIKFSEINVLFEIESFINKN
ncbi:MAG: DUF4435 domain-containing protein [Mycoplasma sp.]|nr:DUF4435 domain-containing protein [Mycoplasma sp.]